MCTPDGQVLEMSGNDDGEPANRRHYGAKNLSSNKYSNYVSRKNCVWTYKTLVLQLYSVLQLIDVWKNGGKKVLF